MSVAFAKKLLEDMPLIPTNKLLKSLLGHIIPSLGILWALPIIVNGFQVQLNFYIFDVWKFDVLIGLPIERLIRLKKEFKLSVPINHSLKTKIEPLPEPDPIEELR
jgi:hypothetical protein